MALLLGLLAALTTLAQDEAEKARISRTTWHSAAVPGWGQINNGKWWKVPIVYGALGVSAHFIQTEGSLYKGYRDGYLAMTDGDPTTIYVTPFDESGVRERRDFHRANLEQSVLTLVLIWGAQIVDAHVDAHLLGFDVSEDLGYMPGVGATMGIRLSRPLGTGKTRRVNLSAK